MQDATDSVDERELPKSSIDELGTTDVQKGVLADAQEEMGVPKDTAREHHTATLQPSTMIPFEPDQLELIFKDEAGAEVRIQVKPKVPLCIPMAAARSRLGVPQHLAKFTSNGVPLASIDTPAKLGLKNATVINISVEKALAVPGAQLGQQPGERPGAKPGTTKLNLRMQAVEQDLEWNCPACLQIQRAETTAVTITPQLCCVHCGWCGYPPLRRASISTVRPKTGGSLSATQTHGPKFVHKSTSGAVLEADYEGQHLEVPVGGLLALVSQVQRERLCTGFVCYALFCITFVLIMTLARPIHEFSEVQGAIRQDLFTEPFLTPGTGTVHNFESVGSWEEFWVWADSMLSAKVFQNRTGQVPLEPYSDFSVGLYGRVLTAIRFRQVKVRPTLPQCPRQSAGTYPTAYEMACTLDPVNDVESCNTPVASHQLARPCWGFWSKGNQDAAYPSIYQKETVQAARDPLHPERDLMCLENCDAFYVQGLRTKEAWLPFGNPGVYAWVEGFIMRLGSSLAEAGAACRSACDASHTHLLGNLSTLAGFCGNRDGKPSQLARSYGDGCWGDVVDVPLSWVDGPKRISAMKRERWTNEGTRSVAVEINVYNPNYDIATAIRAQVEMHPGGRLFPMLEMWSCRLHPDESSVATVLLVLEIVFLVWIVYYLMVEVSELYLKKWEYLMDPWNYIELANIFIYIFTIISLLVITSGATNELHVFRAQSSTQYHDLYTVAKALNSVSLSSFNMVYGFIRFTKYFRMNIRFKVIWDAFALSMQGVIPLVMLYISLLCGFAFAGHWLFGDKIWKFNTFTHSLIYMMISLNEGIDTLEIQQASPLAAPLWHFAWYFSTSVLVLGLLLAMLINSFRQVKQNSEQQRQVEEKALQLGVLMPSPVQSWLSTYFPIALLLFGGKGKASQEVRDALAELAETLHEVDLEALWERLLQGALEDEIAVDAEEIAYLFGGSQKKARHFINRVVNLAKLPKVEGSQEASTKDLVDYVDTAVDRLRVQVDMCGSELVNSNPSLLQELSSQTGGEH